MNKNISKIHLDLLDKKRQALLQKLIPNLTDFVLSGGTALALQLGHRKSFDFDFFSSSPIPSNLLNKFSPTIELKNIVIDTRDELTFITTDNIKVTFLYYPFKPHSKPIRLANSLSIFPVKEIGLQKSYTIGRRGEYRDYFDLYFILKSDYASLNKLIRQAKKVYKGMFDEKLFLEQLVYFGDMLNFEVIPFSKTQLPKPEQIKSYFENLVKTYLAQ